MYGTDNVISTGFLLDLFQDTAQNPTGENHLLLSSSFG